MVVGMGKHIIFSLSPNGGMKAVLTLFYSIALYFVYKDVVYPSYAYMGYSYTEPSFIIMIINIMILCLVVQLIPCAFKKPSDSIFVVPICNGFGSIFDSSFVYAIYIGII